MAVLIEGYSIVINKEQALKNQKALDALGSVEGTLHPTAICSDEDLLRIGFLDLKQANEFLAALEGGGLETSKDMVMLTQFGESEMPCDWLSTQFTKLKDNTLICLASKVSSKPVKGVAMPKGWSLETSLLKRYYEERINYMHEGYRLLREEPMHSVYKHNQTGNEVRLLRLTVKEMAESELQ
ncbi:hypothetical protein THMIRHAM_13740 [Thiomicrorhabdus immobilis]|uniref:GyrI-like small molecule binding domain-containing protein n=1 Tax=Thiomicrorhabdus immobilis TaxID=2791037 RepID=A0ABN6D0X6_9GAMM|nr:hypothetical protein [Thiomicrorhabdus immobilis]BCN93589.1 hypothetical protein THMIRHAM_13740 [Thiomicrorhabdus immobilis]